MKNWLCVSAGIVVGEWFYFTISNGNGLFRCNIEKSQLDYLGRFPKEKENQSHLFYRISHYKNTLFFWAHQAQNHVLYDLEKNRFSDFACESIKINFVENVVNRDKNIYIYGRHEDPYIYRYDRERNDGRYIIKNMNAVKEEYSSFTILASGMAYDDKHAYFPCLTDTILSFNWKTEELVPIYLPLSDACLTHIISMQDSLFLLDITGCLMQYDKRTEEVKSLFNIKHSGVDYIEGKTEYHILLRYEDCLYMVSKKRDCEMICYNYKTDEVYFGDRSLMRNNAGFVELYGFMLYVFDNLKGSLVRINLKTYDTVEIDCTDLFNIADHQSSGHYYINEGFHICNSLSTYIYNIEENLKNSSKLRNCGMEIYEKI